MNTQSDSPPLTPWDRHNQRLVSNVHPSDWTNPTPAPRFNTLSPSDGERAGVRGISVDVNFSKVMERMRRLRADISPHDSARRFTELGVDVFLGGGKFTGSDTVEVAGQTLRFARDPNGVRLRTPNPRVYACGRTRG